MLRTPAPLIGALEIIGNAVLTQLVALFIRCYALWLGLIAVRAFGAQIELDSVNPHSGPALIGLSAIQLGLAIALWFFPFTIAKKLCPPHEAADFSGLTPGGLYSAGMILMGVYWVSRAIYNSFYWATYLAMAGSDTHGVAVEGPPLQFFVMAALEIAVGLALILGRHGIKRAILRLRTGSQDLLAF